MKTLSKFLFVFFIIAAILYTINNKNSTYDAKIYFDGDGEIIPENDRVPDILVDSCGSNCWGGI